MGNNRKKILHLLNDDTLMNIKSLWNLENYQLSIHPQYDGCQNIIYYLTNGVNEYVLRLSFREDRNCELLKAETHFIDYLHSGGANVAYPIISVNNTFVETIRLGNIDIYGVLFVKANGFRLPDKNYQYREGVSLDEYYFNYGKTLGLMHKLTKSYVPVNDRIIRHGLIENMENILIPKYLPGNLNIIKNKFDILISETKQFQKDKDSYGLIHADFGDGNFTIDYTNGNITIFDFDDSAYCWFMYDIADAWTKGTGWAMSEKCIEKRKNKMNEYFGKIMNAYSTENTINDKWLSKLPFFIKIVEMEALISEFQSSVVNSEVVEYDEEMNYRIECIEKDIQYLGFFDKIYDHENPFCLIKENS